MFRQYTFIYVFLGGLEVVKLFTTLNIRGTNQLIISILERYINERVF